MGEKPDSTGQAVVALHVCAAAAGVGVLHRRHIRNGINQCINNTGRNVVAARAYHFGLCQHIHIGLANVDLCIVHCGKINPRGSSDAGSLRDHGNGFLNGRQRKANRHRCIGCRGALHAKRQAHVVQLCAGRCFQQRTAGALLRNLNHHVVQLRHAFQGKHNRVCFVQGRGRTVHGLIVPGIDFRHQIAYILQRKVSGNAVLRYIGKLGNVRQSVPPPLAGCVLAGCGSFHTPLPALPPAARTSLFCE